MLLFSFIYFGNAFGLAFLTKLSGVCFVYPFNLLGDWNLSDKTVTKFSIIENTLFASGPWIWEHLYYSLFTLAVLTIIREIIESDYQGTAIALHLEQMVPTFVGGCDGALLIHLET